jgi:hypothetical protein
VATLEEKALEGRRALQVFYNYSLKNGGGMASFGSYGAFEAYFDKLPAARDNWRIKIGDAILFAKYPFSRVDKAMKTLADAYDGRIPDGARGGQSFLEALYEDSISISYKTSLVVDAVKETAADIGKFAIGGIAVYAAGALVVLYIAMSGKRVAV